MIYLAVLCNPLLAAPPAQELLVCLPVLCSYVSSYALSHSGLLFSLLALAHTRISASKSVPGSDDESQRLSLSCPQAVMFLNTQHEQKFVNIVMCLLIVSCPID